MVRYGSAFDLDLNQGLFGFEIPIYTYSDNMFTIPVSLGYSTGGGYRPNVQSGPVGLGWTLNAGGAITREIRGIADEEGWTSTDMYRFDDKFEGNVDATTYVPDVYGWASVYDTTYVHSRVSAGIHCDISRRYFEDFVFMGKPGTDYLPVWTWNNADPVSGQTTTRGPSFERTPDLFRFSFMGRSGVFLLLPGGEVKVYATDDTPLNYSVEATLTREGFYSFSITTEDHTIYTFGPEGREWSESYNTAGTTENVRLCSCWRLTGIEAPDGRTVTFTYGETDTRLTYSPTYTDEMNRLYKRGSGAEGEDMTEDRDYMQTVPTVSEVWEKLLTRITVTGRCEISFSYSSRRPEAGAPNLPKRLTGISVLSLQGSHGTIRTASLTHHLSGTSAGSAYPSSGTGVTFLESVSIPGTGVWTLHYDSETSPSFPAIGTYAVDWMGYYNGNTTQTATSGFCPTRAVLETGSKTWMTSMRQGGLAAARMGMLSSVTYPTGGKSEFSYGLNSYRSDLAYPRTISSDQSGYGIRIESIINRDTDGTLLNRRTFAYVQEGGTKSSGVQLWRPVVYAGYRLEMTDGYERIEHRTVTSSDIFPFARGPHMEYTRVLETVDKGPLSASRSITERTYLSHAASLCRDRVDEWDLGNGSDSRYGVGAWQCTVSNEYQMNGFMRNETEMYMLSRQGGRLSAETVFSDDLDHPVRKTLFSPGTYQQTGGDLFFDEVLLGCLVSVRRDMMGTWTQGDTRTEYDLSGNEISSISITRLLDADHRLASSSFGDSMGGTVTTYYEYLSACPSLLTRLTRARVPASGSRVLIESVRRSYDTAGDHEWLFVPTLIETSASGGSSLSGTGWVTEASCQEYSDQGLPLEIIDKAGIPTALVWEYGGLCLAAKVVGKTYSQIITSVPAIGSNGGVFSGAMPASVRSSLLSLSGALASIWQHEPLVGTTGETDPSGRTTSFGYDSYGRLVSILNPAGETLSSFDYTVSTEDGESFNRIVSRAVNTSDFAEDIVYYDGLGYSRQEVAVGASGYAGLDLIRPVVRDHLFREAETWLPYADDAGGSFVTDAESDQLSFYRDLYSVPESSECSWEWTRLESAEGGRPVAKYLPGPQYQEDGHGTEYTYLANTSSSGSHPVRRLTVNLASGAMSAAYYSAAVLSGVETVDADGRRAIVWTDREGRTVSEQRWYEDANGVEKKAETLYGYDAAGRLRWVVSPNGSEVMTNGSSYALSSDFAKKHCFVYSYDAHDRLTEKRLPGAASAEFVYDNGDRLVMSRDGNLAATGKWKTVHYDDLGRAFKETHTATSLSRASLQASFSNGIAPAVYSSSSATVLVQKTFDTYPSSLDSQVTFAQKTGFPSRDAAHLKGMLTLERVNIIDSQNSIVRAYHYDALGRVLQTAETTAEGGVLRITHQFDRQGNELKALSEYTGATGSSLSHSLLTERSIDARGRVLNETSTLDGTAVSSVVRGYDELGREDSRLYGNGAGQLTENLSYNLQGWRTEQTVTKGNATLFSSTLRYDEPFSAEGGNVSWTGKISSWTTRQGSAAPLRTYVFSYDGLGRLTDNRSYNGTLSDGLFRESARFDLNGNISSMTRYNGSSSPEVLSWTLDGNQVSDSDEYFYDPAGNLLTIIPDPEYPLEARYNILNLPKRFFQNESDTDVALSYLYDGTKGAAIDAEGKGYRYAGPFRFLQTASGALVLESAASAGGRIVNVNANPDGSVSSTTPDLQVRYFITDHLGSVRLIADAAGNVLERNDFLPFGEKCQNNGLVSAENPYLYGGKELQTFFGIDWYDSGARFQKTDGTFSSLDPKAESYYPISPYAYCAGDPVNYVDPEGFSWYYNMATGKYIGQIDDGDDTIYMLTEEQIDKANGDPKIWQSFRDTDYFTNIFSQMGLEGSLNEMAAKGVVEDLFDRANRLSESRKERYIDSKITINVDLESITRKAESTSKTMTAFVKELYSSPYDNISLFSHEIKHIIDRCSGKLTNRSYANNPAAFELDADSFSIKHWSYRRSSDIRKKDLEQHMGEQSFMKK